MRLFGSCTTERQRLSVLRCAALALLAALSAAVRGTELPGPLVEPAWLAAHRDDVLVLDVRTNPAGFARTGHVPGAVMLDAGRIQAARSIDGAELDGMVPEEEAFAALMRAHGVDRDSTIVISSAGRDAIDATYMARLYWTLKYYGHDRVAVLNGATQAWANAGRPLSHERSSPVQGNFRATVPGRGDILATSDEVERALRDGSRQLVDARTLGYYLGLYKEPYVEKRGHIPGAHVFPYALALDGARFRSHAELQDLADAFGIDASAPLIVYCNTGVLSAAGWFIFHELLGHRDAVLYDGSMHAWSKGGRRPVETMKLNVD